MSPLDRSLAPDRQGAEPVRLPEFQRRRLQSGPVLYSLRQKTTPLVAIQVVLPASGQADPPDRPGLAAFTADLMEQGTRSRSATRVADEVESLGGKLASGAGWSSSSVTLSMLGMHFAEGLALLTDVATEPAFALEEVERLRRERRTAILHRRDQASSLAQAALARTVYGESAYGHPLIGGEQSLSAINRDEIVDFFARHRAPTATKIIAVGDLPQEELESRLNAAFAATGGGTTEEAPPPIEAPRLRRLHVVVVDRPQAAQTELRLAHAGAPRLHPDRIPLTVMNSLLGGKFMSRINLNLRERHGFTYGAHSTLALRLGPGPFVVSTAVANDVARAAVGEILLELRRIRDDAISEDELHDTINYLQGVFPYGLQTTGGLLQRLRALAIFGLPDDYFDSYVEQIGTVTTDDVQRVAQQHLFPDELAIIAVGPADNLCRQLEVFAEPQVLTASSLLT